jgi:hypothetical protein
LGRITAAWLDDPGSADDPTTGTLNDARAKLVKNVDLSLESPSGKRYFAWSLDPQTKRATNDLRPNERDNVERIDVPMGRRETGTWRLTVSCSTSKGAACPPLRVALATYGFEP